MTKQKHSGMQGVKTYIDGDVTIVSPDNASAYSHKSNSALDRTLLAANQQSGLFQGDVNDLKETEIDWHGLGLDQQIHGAEIAKLAETIVRDARDFNPNNYGSLTNYEANTAHTNKILDNMAASKLDGASGQIMGIVTLTKEFSRDLTRAPGWWTKFLGIGKRTHRDVKEKYDTVSERLNVMLKDLDAVQANLEDGDRAIDELDDINKKEYHATSLYIAAGRMAMNQMVRELKVVGEDGQPVVVRDFQIVGQLHGLEKRLHDLEGSQTHRRQQAQQYRMILDNNKAVVNKLASVSSTLIPTWRSGITTALALQDQQKGAELVDAIQDASNQFILENSRMLRDSTVTVARLSQRSLFDVNVLKEVQQNLETAMSDVVRIHHEGSERRNSEMNEVRQLNDNIDKFVRNEVGRTIERVTAKEDKPLLNIEERVEHA